MCITPYTKVLKEPIRVDTETLTWTVDLPCGKCIECLENIRRQWTFRLSEEAKHSIDTWFITLTYNTENIPIDPKTGELAFHYPHIQTYINTIRKTAKRDGHQEKISYFVVGERGTLKDRPHYHMILFNCPPQYIDKYWTHGNTHYGKCEVSGMKYALKYIYHGEEEEWNQDIRQWCKKFKNGQFRHMSKGIGRQWLEKNGVKTWIKKNPLGKITMEDGTKIGIPRYYIDAAFSYVENGKRRINKEAKSKRAQRVLKKVDAIHRNREAKYKDPDKEEVKRKLEKSRKKRIMQKYHKSNLT